MWKATISFVLSLRLSVRMEQLGSHWTDFHEIWYLCMFRKSIEKTRASLWSDKNDGLLSGETFPVCCIEVHKQ